MDLTPTPADVLASWIACLHATDLDARERAAAKLKTQGSAAIPALRKALTEPDLDESSAWWLQAVLQHIERTDSRAREVEPD